MVRLLNAAVMPREGIYVSRAITLREYAEMVRHAHQSGEMVSYIGYPETALLVEDLTGVPIPVCRDSTPVEDGDILLVARLKYRVPNPRDKGRMHTGIDDYEFFRIAYYEHDRQIKST